MKKKTFSHFQVEDYRSCQKTVSAYFSSKQILPFSFTEDYMASLSGHLGGARQPTTVIPAQSCSVRDDEGNITVLRNVFNLENHFVPDRKKTGRSAAAWSITRIDCHPCFSRETSTVEKNMTALPRAHAPCLVRLGSQCAWRHLAFSIIPIDRLNQLIINHLEHLPPLPKVPANTWRWAIRVALMLGQRRRRIRQYWMNIKSLCKSFSSVLYCMRTTMSNYKSIQTPPPRLKNSSVKKKRWIKVTFFVV